MPLSVVDLLSILFTPSSVLQRWCSTAITPKNSFRSSVLHHLHFLFDYFDYLKHFIHLLVYFFRACSLTPHGTDHTRNSEPSFSFYIQHRKDPAKSFVSFVIYKLFVIILDGTHTQTKLRSSRRQCKKVSKWILQISRDQTTNVYK